MSKKLMRKRAVAERYGVRALRTIERWTRGGVLPPPDQVINGRPYWDEATLDAHDRQQTIARATQRV
jgi:predicted site-specific integrase-resolvase